MYKTVDIADRTQIQEEYLRKDTEEQGRLHHMTAHLGINISR
jgi:hypothetical protein